MRVVDRNICEFHMILDGLQEKRKYYVLLKSSKLLIYPIRLCSMLLMRMLFQCITWSRYGIPSDSTPQALAGRLACGVYYPPNESIIKLQRLLQ